MIVYLRLHPPGGTSYMAASSYRCFTCSGVVDIHKKITYEKMHDSNLGVTRLVLRIIQRRLKETKVPRAFNAIKSQLNIRLHDLDK